MVIAVRIDHRGLNELTRSPTGDVYKYIRKLGRETELLAKRYAPKKTRRLELSVRAVMLQGPSGPEVRVGSPLSYAFEVHEGTRPHVIVPRTQQFLRFSSRGRIVYARAVKHPGTRANPFLRRAMEEVVR